MREACSGRDEIEFVGIDDDENPLILRDRSRNVSGDVFQIWYVPRERGERSWFRDVEESGGQITLGIEDLCAELYGVHRWGVFDDSLEGKRARLWL